MGEYRQKYYLVANISCNLMHLSHKNCYGKCHFAEAHLYLYTNALTSTLSTIRLCIYTLTLTDDIIYFYSPQLLEFQCRHLSVSSNQQAHFELQRATLQYEKANSRHVYARQRVHDAEHRVFSCGEKRVFDTALQEMLNQATIEVKTWVL